MTPHDGIDATRHDTQTHQTPEEQRRGGLKATIRAVAMSFKEVDPVDLLVGTCPVGFLRARLQAHALSRVEPAASTSGTPRPAHKTNMWLQFLAATPLATPCAKTKARLNVLA